MKKGFTLVELLAVIVILAIIALIAVPITINIINNSRESSNKSSVELYGRAVEQALLKARINGIKPTSIDELAVQYTGNEVICETKEFYSDGTIYLAECTVGEVAVDYTYGTKRPCKMSTVNGDRVITCETEAFYVMSQTNDTITMLAEKNITTSGQIIQSSTAVNIAFSSSNYWGPRAGFVYSDNSANIIYPIINSYETYLRSIGVSSANATVMSLEQVIALGCSTAQSSCSSAPRWVYTTSYWLGDSDSNNHIWRILRNGSFGFGTYNDTNRVGIRPVVTISIFDVG